MLTNEFMLGQRMQYLRWELQNSLQEALSWDKHTVFSDIIMITDHIYDMNNFWMDFKEVTESDGVITVRGLGYLTPKCYLKITVSEQGEVNVEIDKEFKEDINND